ncbi:unnamed protein product, partial [Iphiclides podalirius]
MPWSCLWGYESPPPMCRVSGPLHLILQKEGTPQAHAFRRKSFRRPRPCHWCHQPVHNEGSCCRVCKYVCHTACENRASAIRFAQSHVVHSRGMLGTCEVVTRRAESGASVRATVRGGVCGAEHPPPPAQCSRALRRANAHANRESPVSAQIHLTHFRHNKGSLHKTKRCTVPPLLRHVRNRAGY